VFAIVDILSLAAANRVSRESVGTFVTVRKENLLDRLVAQGKAGSGNGTGDGSEKNVHLLTTGTERGLDGG
jgi:hypothetical protein